MEKLRLGIFDTFSILLPGGVLLCLIFILINGGLHNVSDIFQDIPEWNFGKIGLSLLLSYLIGFAIDVFGKMYYKLGKKIWKGKVQAKLQDTYSDSEIRVLARHNSPLNHEYFVTWLGMSNMAHNLSFSLTLGSFIFIYKGITSSSLYTYDWYLAAMGVFLLSVVFLHRSIRYNNSYKRDSAAFVDHLVA
jgi:hypothetical protein